MHVFSSHTLKIACCAVFVAASTQVALSANLCVNHAGSGGCYSTIQNAVNHAAAGDIINVAAGTYKEDVVINAPVSLIGAGAGISIIDATGLSNGIFVDGYDNPGLSHVIVDGFTVKNAQYEGVLVVSAFDVTIRNNRIYGNDAFGPEFTGAPNGCPGQPAFETSETGDCGGGLHLIGTSGSVIIGNQVTYNADGILLSDETAESRDNLITKNVVEHNGPACGITLASHAPVGSAAPRFAPHYGIAYNTISENRSANNGLPSAGSGVGIFADGDGPGSTHDNVIIHNDLTGNGIGGVSLHSHVGPNFGAPADNMSGNAIIGNYIAGNHADTGDTATPGRVGININSGFGGTPIWNTVISGNIIRDEDIDIAVNTSGTVNAHLNDLMGSKTGVANICHTANCGSINATQNFWGCSGKPNATGCSTTSGANITASPALPSSAAFVLPGHDDYH